MGWTAAFILGELRRLDRLGTRLCYSDLTRERANLYYAARYHFGSLAHAIKSARLDPKPHARRPKWSRERIIKLIKKARRADEELNWASVIERTDELRAAAYASVQKRLFGSWDKALNAAGVDADDVRAYYDWSPELVLYSLRQRRADGESVRACDVLDEEPTLHAAAVRHFKCYGKALRRLNKKRKRRTA